MARRLHQNTSRKGGVLEYPETKNSPQISNLRGLDAILTHFSQEHEQTPYPTIKTHYRPSDSISGGLYTFSPTARCPKVFQPYSHCSENTLFSSRYSLTLAPICVIVSSHSEGGEVYVQTDNRFTIW
nr:MAG TPA: hypothetical protein [Caudoviricetes sp.]